MTVNWPKLAIALMLSAVAALAAIAVHYEVPTGVIRGHVVAEETGAALSSARIFVTAEATGKTREIASRDDGGFVLRDVPVGVYTIEATTEVHRLQPTQITVLEGETTSVDLELEPVSAFLDVRTPKHVFGTDEQPTTMVHGFVPVDQVKVDVYRLDYQELMVGAEGNPWRLLNGHGQRWQEALSTNEHAKRVTSESVPITTKDVEGVFNQKIPLRTDGPGIFIVALSAGTTTAVDWIVVSDIAMITKRAGGQIVTYVVDRKSGKPIEGVDVTAYSTKSPLTSGKTDADGLLPLSVTVTAQESYVVTAASWKGSLAYTSSYQWLEDLVSPPRVFAYTDRPVYRPGQDVHYKGMLRLRKGADYATPPSTAVTIEVRDPQGALIYRKPHQTDAYGSYYGSLTLSADATTGYYNVIAIASGKSEYSSFQIAAYVKPEYKVSVSTSRKRYTIGDALSATVEAEYYFGAPVTGAEMYYTVYRSPHYTYAYEYEDESSGSGEGGDYEGYYADSGEVVGEGRGTTDAQGRFHIRLKTAPPKLEEGQDPDPYMDSSMDYTYTIEATVNDESQSYISGKKEVLVTAGDFALEVTPDTWVAQPGDKIPVQVKAIDYDRKPVANTRISVAFERMDWRRDEPSYHKVSSQSVTTDKDGIAKITVSAPEEGEYRVRATAQDGSGNKLAYSEWIWVTGQEYGDFGGRISGVKIVTDKREYEVGDTAHLVITSQHKGVTALFSVEGDRLYSYRTVALKGTVTRIDVPILAEYKPNVFIAIAYVRNGDMVNATKRIRVSVKPQALTVTVKPNKRKYEPGERIRYAIQTKNSSGRGVPAQVSVGVVDEAIYAIAPDNTPKMLDFFYPARDNVVSTVFSAPDIYLDADKAVAGKSAVQQVTIRKDFRDTAYWQPAIVTGDDGRAMVSFKLPDNLTTWRATVRGATIATQVGEATSTVRATMPLLVRLSAPTFFTQLDRATVSGIVHNYADKDYDVTVSLTAEHAAIQGEAERRVRVPRNRSVSVDWTVDVTGAGESRLMVTAKAQGGPSDGMQLTVPINAHGRPRTETRVGIVSGGKTETLFLRGKAIPEATDLKIRIGPSTVATMFTALDYLASYPYGCTEQTMSAFYPDIVVWQTMKQLGRGNPKLERELPKMVNEGLTKLYELQHEDGGWGWWRYDKSDIWMTSYVLYGLMEAKRAGYEVESYRMQYGIEWLTNSVLKSGKVTEDTAFALYVLAQTDRRAACGPKLDRLVGSLDRRQAREQAQLALALYTAGRADQAKAILERLWTRAAVSSAFVYWEAPHADEWDDQWYDNWHDNDVGVTAWVMKAIATITPDDPRLSKIAMWASVQRTGDYWISTKDTALMIDALTGYVRAAKALTPNCVVTVKINGQVVGTLKFTEADLWDPEVTLPGMASHLRKGKNEIAFEQSGPGQISYAVTFGQVEFARSIPKLVTASGIDIQRSYHLLRSQTDPQTGAVTMIPEKRATTSVKSGDMILVRLKIRAAHPCQYVLIEDPIPAGCRGAEQTDLPAWAWDRWWSNMDVRDDKVAVFVDRLPAKERVIEYKIRAHLPGTYRALPTNAYGMYEPEVRGGGDEAQLEIRP